jgi:class 3 adenylate cyclase
MAVGGLPIPNANHAESVANMSLELLDALKDFNEKNAKMLNNKQWNIRIGLHTGSVVAGVMI